MSYESLINGVKGVSEKTKVVDDTMSAKLRSNPTGPIDTDKSQPKLRDSQKDIQETVSKTESLLTEVDKPLTHNLLKSSDSLQLLIGNTVIPKSEPLPEEIPQPKKLDKVILPHQEIVVEHEPEIVIVHEPTVSKEEFAAKLTGMTTKGEALFDKLDPSLQKLAFDAIPSTKEGKKELEKLLHFSGFKLGNTTDVQRLEIRAVLLAAVGLGASKEELEALKDKLRNGTAEQTTKMLEALNDPKKLIQNFKGEPSEVDPTSMPRLRINKPELLEVSVSTLQNLKGAQLVNFAVKSIINDGAPNQAPDLMRTKGENILLFTNQNKVSTELGKDELVTSNITKAMELDEARKRNGAKVGIGEDFVNIISKAPSTAVLGTGKCGEHAAISFALLTDPLSRKQMGIELQPGTQIILALGDKIDHNYVLLAEPGSVNPVNSTQGTFKRIDVKDPNKVVVVDPWMPIPVSHTLSRCNDDIQTKEKNEHEAVWKLIVVIQEDGSPAILDKHKDTGEDVLTPIPSFGEKSMLDQLKELQEKYQPGVKQRALVKGIVPLDEEERLVTGSGVAVRDGAGKAGMYTRSHLSTDTPGDLYQALDKDKNPIGEPVDLFMGQQSYLESEYPNIERGLDTTVKDIVRNKLDKLPEDLRQGVEIVLNH